MFSQIYHVQCSCCFCALRICRVKGMGNIFCAWYFFQQVRNIHRVNYKSIHFYICIKKNRDGVDVKETTSPKLTDQKRDI